MESVEELVYRPLFLRMARLGGRPFAGTASFSSSRPGALRSLAALERFLSGAVSAPRLLPEGGVASGQATGGLELRLRPADAADPPGWAGRGELRSGDALFRFEIGAADRLEMETAADGRSRVFLPEGGAERYARLDAEECAAQDRESRILGPAARLAAEAFPEWGRA